MTKSSAKGKKRSFEYAKPPTSYDLSGNKKAKPGEGPLFDFMNRRRSQTTGEVSSKSEDDPPLNPDIEAPEADVALESHAKHSEESASLEPYVERSEGKASLQSTIVTSEDDAGFQLAIKRSEESAALELDIKRSEEEADLQLAIKRSEEDVSLAPNVGHSEDNATLGILSKPSEFEPAVEDDGEPPDDDATPGQKKKNNKPWTPEEDAIITQFAGKLEWKEIAAKMPSRSIPTIRRRWATKLSPVALRMKAYADEAPPPDEAAYRRYAQLTDEAPFLSVARSVATIAKVSGVQALAPDLEDPSDEMLEEDERLEEDDEQHILLTGQLDQALEDPFGHLERDVYVSDVEKYIDDVVERLDDPTQTQLRDFAYRLQERSPLTVEASASEHTSRWLSKTTCPTTLKIFEPYVQEAVQASAGKLALENVVCPSGSVNDDLLIVEHYPMLQSSSPKYGETLWEGSPSMRFLSRKLWSRKNVCVIDLVPSLCSRDPKLDPSSPDSQRPYMKAFGQETINVFHQLFLELLDASKARVVILGGRTVVEFIRGNVPRLRELKVFDWNLYGRPVHVYAQMTTPTEDSPAVIERLFFLVYHPEYFLRHGPQVERGVAMDALFNAACALTGFKSFNPNFFVMHTRCGIRARLSNWKRLFDDYVSSSRKDAMLSLAIRMYQAEILFGYSIRESAIPWQLLGEASRYDDTSVDNTIGGTVVSPMSSTSDSPFKYHPTSPEERDCSTGDLYLDYCGRKFGYVVVNDMVYTCFDPRSVRTTSVAHKILVNVWRHYGMAVGTKTVIGHRFRLVLDHADIPVASRGTTARFLGSVQQREHVISSVKTLSASIAASDTEVIEAVRDHARHVAIQAINSGLYAARKDLRKELQITKLSTEQEVELRSTFGLAPTPVMETRARDIVETELPNVLRDDFIYKGSVHAERKRRGRGSSDELRAVYIDDDKAGSRSKDALIDRLLSQVSACCSVQLSPEMRQRWAGIQKMWETS